MLENEIIDNQGRVFVLKEINGKTRLSFYRVLGSQECDNKAVLAELWPVMAVDSIDGKKQPISQLVDIEYIHARIDESDAKELILDWMVGKDAEKKRIAAELKASGAKDIKK